jgi:hypothetical protein
VANLNLPTPVVLAGAGLCLLGGYLIGVVAGPDTPERTTGTVESYDARSNELCLSGDSVDDQDGAEDGELCGVWQRTTGSPRPREGDSFRFVSKVSKQQSTPDDDRVLIFGEVDN